MWCVNLSPPKYEVFFAIYSFLCINLNGLVRFSKNFYQKLPKLTNTFKLIHRIEQNTNRTSYLDEEEFHAPHALSL